MLHYYFSEIKSGLSARFNEYDVELLDSLITNVWNIAILKELIVKYSSFPRGEAKISPKDEKFLDEELNFDVTKYGVKKLEVEALGCNKDFTSLLAIPTKTDSMLLPVYNKLKGLLFQKPYSEFICEILKDEDFRKFIQDKDVRKSFTYLLGILKERLSRTIPDFDLLTAKENFDFLISVSRLIEMTKDGTEIDDDFPKLFYAIHPILYSYDVLSEELNIVKAKITKYLKKKLGIRIPFKFEKELLILLFHMKRSISSLIL